MISYIDLCEQVTLKFCMSSIERFSQCAASMKNQVKADEGVLHHQENALVNKSLVVMPAGQVNNKGD